MTRFTCKVFALALALLSLPAAAAPIQWELSGNFDGGGNIAGTFTYDFISTTAGLILGWDIQVFGGDEATFPPFAYTPPATAAYTIQSPPGRQATLIFTGPPILIEPDQPARPRQLRITPSLALDGSVDFVPLFTMLNSVDLGAEECYNCAPFRHIGSGAIQRVSKAVPEPSTLVLWAVGGLLVLGARLRQQKRA